MLILQKGNLSNFLKNLILLQRMLLIGLNSKEEKIF